MGFITEENTLLKYIEEPGITDVVIPEGITRIWDEAFKDCRSLVHITVPETAESIFLRAFQGCVSLQSIVLPTGLRAITNETFQGCRSLRQIDIPSCGHIGNAAFQGCPCAVNLKGE